MAEFIAVSLTGVLEKEETSTLLTALFSILALIALFPLFCWLLASFKPSTELVRFSLNLTLQPELLSLDNYIYLFTAVSISDGT
ncbi:hypothetical protein [Novibacillus thermophilus]|uniref:ABC transmembrane type-1 domain-containing protein n=1 Tax=Novibacillus thermophilus TaxID=1471761 RepID=A0A1U9K3V5_9BACL|nr:hypothetical protein [Novibacillus thermophilus]AQS54727.1 hypothetical protein B0W44_02005 [Novibacillus thermophilus]